MNIIPNLFFIGIGGLMIWQIVTAPAGRALQPGDPGPWALPMLLGLTLVALGAAEIIRKARRRPATGAASDTAETVGDLPQDVGISLLAPPPVPRRIVFLVALLAYVAGFQALGFTLATAAFLFVAVIALSETGVKALLPAAMTAVLTSLAIGWLLAGVVGVPLPGVLLVP